MLGHALVSGGVPKGCAAHLTHLLDEAPAPLVVMAVEEAGRFRYWIRLCAMANLLCGLPIDSPLGLMA